MITPDQRLCQHGRRIWTLSRKLTEQFKGDKPYCVVSITNPYSLPVDFPQDPFRTSVLSVDFWDVEESTGPYRGITSEQATEIACFVQRQLIDNPEIEFVVHCEAGVSRSAGCAGAISKYLDNFDQYWFAKTGTFIPNRLVYTSVLNALVEVLGVPSWL